MTYAAIVLGADTAWAPVGALVFAATLDGMACTVAEHDDHDTLSRASSLAGDPAARTRIQFGPRAEIVKRLGYDPAEKAAIQSVLTADATTLQAELAKLAEATGITREPTEPDPDLVLVSRPALDALVALIGRGTHAEKDAAIQAVADSADAKEG